MHFRCALALVSAYAILLVAAVAAAREDPGGRDHVGRKRRLQPHYKAAPKSAADLARAERAYRLRAKFRTEAAARAAADAWHRGELDLDANNFRRLNGLVRPLSNAKLCNPVVVSKEGSEFVDSGGNVWVSFDVKFNCDKTSTTDCNIAVTLTLTADGNPYPAPDGAVWGWASPPDACGSNNNNAAFQWNVGEYDSMPPGEYDATFIVWANTGYPFDPNNLPVAIAAWDYYFFID